MPVIVLHGNCYATCRNELAQLFMKMSNVCWIYFYILYKYIYNGVSYILVGTYTFSPQLLLSICQNNLSECCIDEPCFSIYYGKKVTGIL